MPRQITAFSNPLIKRVRNLRDKRHRRAEGLFLAEGLRILTEAREVGQLPHYLFFAGETAGHPLVAALVEATEAAGGEAIETNADLLSKLSGKDNPGSVVGVYPEFAVALDALDRAAAPIWLVAERLRDPGNLGTILRTADAVGAGGLILLDECVDPFSVEAVRASMGALFTVPVARAAWADFHAWLRGGPGQLVGLSLDNRHRLSRRRLCGADLPAHRQRGARHARFHGGRMRPAGEDPDARQGRQPQRRDRDRGDGVRGARAAIVGKKVRKVRPRTAFS